ncbi:MAG TPA: hypothetical protein VE525_05990 [Rubrobacter sp.]|nr:hypothetical protein [Rubrobacter sp.]
MSRGADQQFNLVPIPEDIPELGIVAGYLGTVDHTYPVRGEAGRGLYVEVSRPEGTTVGFTQLEAGEEGAWHVMTYTPFY